MTRLEALEKILVAAQAVLEGPRGSNRPRIGRA